MKIKIIKEAKMLKENVQIINNLEDFKYDLGKELGSGMYGTVYEGTDQEGNEYAIKEIDNSQGHGTKEAIKYRVVSNARKEHLIAKHFPETFAIFNDKENDKVYIVMEKLTNKVAKALRVGDLFPGLEAHVDSDDEVDLYPDLKKTLRRKLYEMFQNKISRDYITKFILFGNNKITKPEEFRLLNKVVAETDFPTYLSHPKIKDTDDKLHVSLMKKVDNLPSVDSKLIFIDIEYLMSNPSDPDKLKYEFLEFPGVVVYFFKLLEITSKLFLSKSLDVGKMAKRFSQIVRKKTPVGIYGNYVGDAEDERWKGLDTDAASEAFPEVKSILQAIKVLKLKTGLVARDMHDDNVMVRESTGDLVIVDLGLFSTESKSINESNNNTIKVSYLNSNKKIYKILDQELKEHIHSLQILIR